jgi:hypothetical protein
MVAWRHASRRGRRPNWAGVNTVLLTVLVLLLSNLPNSFTQISESIDDIFSDTDGDTDSETENESYIYLDRVAYFVSYINIMANFFIYSLTVPSFTEFLKQRISVLLYLLSGGRSSGQRDQFPQSRRANSAVAPAPTQNISHQETSA